MIEKRASHRTRQQEEIVQARIVQARIKKIVQVGRFKKVRLALTEEGVDSEFHSSLRRGLLILSPLGGTENLRLTAEIQRVHSINSQFSILS